MGRQFRGRPRLGVSLSTRADRPKEMYWPGGLGLDDLRVLVGPVAVAELAFVELAAANLAVGAGAPSRHPPRAQDAVSTRSPSLPRWGARHR